MPVRYTEAFKRQLKRLARKYRIYYLQTTNDVLLVTIYSKAEQADIEVTELKQILDEEGE